MAPSKESTSKQPIEKIVQLSVNPFNPSIKAGNFWQDDYQDALEVKSIHQDVIERVESAVAQMAHDHVTRTILIQGESGSGKSYLLGRIKRELNDRAFFVYVGPCPEPQSYIWRHTLRNTVDSLMQVPEGESESQISLWLRSLLKLQNQKKSNWLQEGCDKFVNIMKAAYPVGLYRAKDFFRALYALTQSETFDVACDWLRGDDLDEDDLKKLKIRGSIDSEDAAQKILNNIGLIARETQPIVICFDQIDTTKGNYQAVLDINSTFHNSRVKNFLIIISVITDAWRVAKEKIQTSDLASIGQTLELRKISTDQAEEIWAANLYPLHRLANPRPKSPIDPLKREWLDAKVPGGKTLPRIALMIGETLVNHFKRHGKLPPVVPGTETETGPTPLLSTQFILVWQKEFKASRQRVSRIQQFSSPELIQRLREALEALSTDQIKTSILGNSRYSANSLSFKDSDKSIGVVWSEERNMQTFFHVMNACRSVNNRGAFDKLILVRSESTGGARNRGHQLYQQLFDKNTHLKPNLDSLYFLETYQKLVNDSGSRELVVGQKEISLKELRALVRETKVLDDCPILKELFEAVRGIGPGPVPVPGPGLKKVEGYLYSLIETQHILGRTVFLKNAKDQFSHVSDSDLESILVKMCQTGRIRIVDPSVKPEQQVICLVPS